MDQLRGGGHLIRAVAVHHDIHIGVDFGKDRADRVALTLTRDGYYLGPRLLRLFCGVVSRIIVKHHHTRIGQSIKAFAHKGPDCQPFVVTRQNNRNRQILAITQRLRVHIQPPMQL